MGDREDAERERRYAAMAEAMRWTSMGSGQRPPLEQPADGVGWPVERYGELAADARPRDRCANKVGGDAVAVDTGAAGELVGVDAEVMRSDPQ